MANKKITDLPDIGTPDPLDVLEIVDVSTNTSKKVLFSELGGGGGSQSLDEVLAVGNTTDLPAIFESEFSRVTVSPDVNVKVEALGTPFVESTTYNDGSIAKVVDANQTALNFQTPTGTGTIQIPDVVDATEIIATREWVTANGSTPPNATETVAGIAEIATTAEVSTGTDDTRIVTPLKLKAVTDTKFELPALTNGSVLFSNGSTIAQDNANLFWDDTNNRLGIGAISPQARLDVRAQGALSTDIAFRVRNSANSANLLTVLGNNNIGIGIDNPLDRLHISQTVAGSNNVLRMSSASGSANVISFRNADASIQGAFLASGSTFSYGTYISNQCNLTGGAGGLGFRVTNTGNINLYGGNADADFAVNYFRLFGATGNVQIQNGGTYIEITSARLAVNSTTQGFLPPRMTNAQRLAIASPAIGLMVYCTDAVEGLYVNKSTGWTFVI